MTNRTAMDVELLLHWTYRDELSKRHLSAAEGIWDRVHENQQHGGIDRGHGAAQRYSHFGLPDPDAELVEKAVSALKDMVIDWDQHFDVIAGDLSGLISVNEMARRETPPRTPQAGWGAAGRRAVKAFYGEYPRLVRDRPRDVLMVGGLRTSALVTMHAVKGTRPDWREEPPAPMPTPATKGPNAMIVGECKGRNLYSAGSYCPLIWSPSPLSIVSGRAEYIAWHDGLTLLAETLRLAKFIPLAPKAARMPWLDDTEEADRIIPVMPTGHNQVSAWGTLPLAPARGRMGASPRAQPAGSVRYPLSGEVA